MVQNAVFVIVRAEDIIQLLSGQHSNDDMDLSFADAYCTSVLDACTFPDLPCESATRVRIISWACDGSMVGNYNPRVPYKQEGQHSKPVTWYTHRIGKFAPARTLIAAVVRCSQLRPDEHLSRAGNSASKLL